MNDFLAMTAAQVEALSPEQAEAALAAWVKAKRLELPEALAASRSRAHAKLAKKALYQLKSLGLEVKAAPTPAAPAEPKAVEGDASAGLEAVISPVVGTGERAFLLAAPIRGGGVEVFQGILSDEFGLVQFGSGTTNRNTYRARMRELERDGSLKVLKVPLSRMKSELGRAMTLNERTNTKLPDEWDTALRKLGVAPEDPDFPIPPLQPEDARDAQAAAALHAEAEIAQWMPSETELAALAKKAEELRASPLALTDAQQREQLEQHAVALAREAMTADKRTIYARRLWLTAELFDSTDRATQAAKARAEARRLVHSTEPSPFLERLFTKALDSLQPPAPAP